MKRLLMLFAVCSALSAVSCEKTGADTDAPEKEVRKAMIEACKVNGEEIPNGGRVSGVDAENVEITLLFSSEIDIDKLVDKTVFITGPSDADLDISVLSDQRTIVLKVSSELSSFSSYTLNVFKGENLGVKIVEDYRYTIVTGLDESPKFEEIPDEDLMTLVQERTFRYFWDHAHPVSGLARERYGSGNTVTSGGSGFGIMTIPVAVERGFKDASGNVITREAGAERMQKIVRFLDEKAETFHGVYSHWLDGETGEAMTFSQKDDGADLVETAFLIQGLLAVHQYFDRDNDTEKYIRSTIRKIWEEVEWDWFTKNGENRLYWHWSEKYGWEMNMPVSGWNEGLIVYVLAASSPTHPISKDVYDEGWALNGGMRNGGSYYGIELPLGSDKGGPMFFAHYSFLGLDPKGLSDAWCSDYFAQNVAHAKINHAYCKENPRKYYGYSGRCWGLTACDIPDGYNANSPTNDTGTIAPTAALASFPYTPEESMEALKYFYYILGDKLLGDYGFRDAFNLSRTWFASSYLAIDQGPIVVMMENHRTGLLWDLFMSHQDVQSGLQRLGFVFNK